MDDLLLGYLLDALGPAEKAAVEAHLRAHPADERKLDRLRRVLRPLEADRDDPDPPPGLAVAAIARVAEHVVATRPREPSVLGSTEEIMVCPVLTPPPVGDPGEPSVETVPARGRDPVRGRGPVRRWVEAAVAVGIGFLTVGLVLAGVQKLRAHNQMVACRHNLEVLHQGLSGYAEVHNGNYPQVRGPADPTARTAGAFVTVLVKADHYPGGFTLVCPAAGAAPPEVDGFRPDRHTPPGPAVTDRVGYTYTLGYRTAAGTLVGLRQTGADGPVPLAADLPARGMGPAAGPTSPHRRGQNVLYTDGHVQFFTTAAVGPDGDHIYWNKAHQVKAGVDRSDVVLGRATRRAITS